MPESQSDTPHAKRVRALFALAGLGLVVIGQIILYASPTYQQTGIPAPFWLCVAGVILFLGSRAIRPPYFLQALAARVPSTRPTYGVAAALLMSLLTVTSMALFERVGNLNYLPVLSLWAFSGICYILAHTKKAPPDFKWRAWIGSHRNELIGIGVVTLVGLLVRFYQLGSIPRVINGDEGRLGLAAGTTGMAPLSNPFALWENMGALYLQGMNFAIKLFGPTPFSLRLLGAIGGTLAIPAIYLFASQVAGRQVALIAASLLAFSHFHINFSRTSGADNVHTTWLAPLVLYLLLGALENRSNGRAALAGVLLAVYFTVFQPAQMIAGLILVYILLAFLFQRSWLAQARRQVAVFWGGFLILGLPEMYYIWKHPNEFLDRLMASGTFQSGWLSETAASTGQSALQILAGRVVHAFLSLIYYPPIDFYGSPTPPLTLLTAALFLIGLGISLWRTRAQGHLLLNGYFWGLTLVIGIFGVPPSADSYRILIVLPAAIVMAAIGFDQILEMAGLGWNSSRAGYTLAASILLSSLLVTNLWVYYVDFAGRCLYADNRPSRFASYLGSYAHTAKREDTIYLLSNSIYFYGSHASVDFLSQGRKIVNVEAPADTLMVASGSKFVANPDRFDELKKWAVAHPGGRLHFFYDCGNMIMVTYEFP